MTREERERALHAARQRRWTAKNPGYQREYREANRDAVNLKRRLLELCGLDGCARVIAHVGACRPTWHAGPVCGAPMPLAGTECARGAGHPAGAHRSRWAMDYDRDRQRGNMTRLGDVETPDNRSVTTNSTGVSSMSLPDSRAAA